MMLAMKWRYILFYPDKIKSQYYPGKIRYWLLGFAFIKLTFT